MIHAGQTLLLILALVCAGCSKSSVSNKKLVDEAVSKDSTPLAIAGEAGRTPDVKTKPSILSWESVDGLPQQLAIFDHVFWEPDDTSTFRKLIRDQNIVGQKRLLEIGAGSGLVSLCCLQAGASAAVATDINPWAVKNTQYNSAEFGFESKLNVRLVSQKRPDAWAVIGADERFDVIFSNPPWELGTTTKVEDFAFYDPGFKLMTSFLEELPDHLNPGGRAFLAYGCVQAIRQLQQESAARKFECVILDDRNLDQLPNLFLPGMLLEIRMSNDAK